MNKRQTKDATIEYVFIIQLISTPITKRKVPIKIYPLSMMEDYTDAVNRVYTIWSKQFWKIIDIESIKYN